jgi:hypothetical protein
VALKLIKPGMDRREVVACFESERQALSTGTASWTTLPAGATTGKVQVVTLSGTTLSSNAPFTVLP